MQLSATEISELIQQKIQNFDAGVEARTEGTVVSLTDGIARIHGLSDVMQGEMIEFPATFSEWRLTRARFRWCCGLGRLHADFRSATAKCTGRILKCLPGASCSVGLSTRWVNRSTVRAQSKLTSLRLLRKWSRRHRPPVR